MTDRLTKSEVISLRLSAHHLTARLSNDRLLEAAGPCGIQNSPPGSALLALHARVRDFTREQVERAVAEDKTLLQTWSMRGAPFYFPTADAPTFTIGVLPPTEAAMRHFITGVEQAIDRLDMRLSEAVERTQAEIGDVLAGRQLAINELGAELSARIARTLPQAQRSIWEEPGPYAPDQPLGEGVVHFCLRILTLHQIICFAPRTGNKAPFVLAEEWLGHPIPGIDPEVARSELLRRYLHCYGPSTRKDFAAWVGIQAADADLWWNLVEDELTPVEFNGPAWLLPEDLPTLRATPRPGGVRLLPPRDPYTQMRDRDTIVEKKYHRDIWKPVGEPGTVLIDGKITGTWRPNKRGRKLTVSVKTFDSLPGREKDQIQNEAEQIAPLRDASSVHVEFDTY